MVGKPEFIGRVYWRNDRTIYRRRATAGNRGGIPYETGLLIFGVSIALYTAFGGFRASVLNDTLQGLVMLVGTIVLLVGVIHAAGGLSQAVDTLHALDPKLVTPQGADDILSPAFMTSFGYWSVLV